MDVAFVTPIEDPSDNTVLRIPEQIGRRSGVNRPPFRPKSATLPEQIGHPWVR